METLGLTGMGAESCNSYSNAHPAWHTDRVSSEKGSGSVTPTLSFILGNQFINPLQVQGKGLEETQHPSEAIH